MKIARIEISEKELVIENLEKERQNTHITVPKRYACVFCRSFSRHIEQYQHGYFYSGYLHVANDYVIEYLYHLRQKYRMVTSFEVGSGREA